jgi:hypothetical protein
LSDWFATSIILSVGCLPYGVNFLPPTRCRCLSHSFNWPASIIIIFFLRKDQKSADRPKDQPKMGDHIGNYLFVRGIIISASAAKGNFNIYIYIYIYIYKKAPYINSPIFTIPLLYILSHIYDLDPTFESREIYGSTLEWKMMHARNPFVFHPLHILYRIIDSFMHV